MKLFAFLLPALCWAAPICYFQPPEGWLAAQPKELSQHVQIGFVGKGSTDFRPSINLATEEIDCGMREYLSAVKKIHLSQPKTTWRDLGKIEMKAGKGRLTEIVTPSPWGDIQMLQAIYIRDQVAHIMTAAVLKADFLQVKESLISSLCSLNFAEDLAAAIPTLELKQEFNAIFTRLGHHASEELREQEWKELQEFITDKTGAMGGYWQFLALREGRTKIYTAKP